MNNLLTRIKLHNLLFMEPNKVFRQLLEESRAGVYIADNDGNLLYVNSAFVIMLGGTRKEEFIGKNLAKELYVNPKDREYFLKAMEKSGFVADYQVANYRKDGSIVTLSVTSNWIKDDVNQIIGVEGIVQDITQRQKIEESLKEERIELAEILDFEDKLNLLHDVTKLASFSVEQIAQILHAQKCSLMLYDTAMGNLCIQAAKGLSLSTVQNAHNEMGQSIAGNVAQKREPVLVTNIEYDKIFQRQNRPYYSTRSFMSVPILFGSELFGVINVADKLSKSWEVFSKTDLNILCIMARAIGVAIENARLFQQLQKHVEI